MVSKPKAEFQRWRPDDEPLTPAVINQIRWSIRDKAHDPAQARRLLAQFIEQTRGGTDRRVTAELVGHLCEAFEAYLADPKKGRLEAALGLTAPKRRPPSAKIDQRHDHIAWNILQERLRGRSHRAAVELTAAEYTISPSQADKVWLARRSGVFDYECMRRHLAGRRPPLFTRSEAAILSGIYGKAILTRSALKADSAK